MKKSLLKKYAFYHNRYVLISLLVYTISIADGWCISARLGSHKSELDTKVSLQCHSCSMKEALDMLSAQAKLKFVYSYNDIEGISFKSLDFTNTALARVLHDILEPHQLTYKLMSERIVIKRNQVVPTGTIRGKVVDVEDSKEVLIGASVKVLNTDRGAITDMDGHFEIAELPEGTYTLNVSYLGYQTQQIKGVQVISNNVAEVKVALHSSTAELNEIVIRGDIPVKYAPIVHSTEESMVQAIREMPGITTGISNFQITQSLDRNAGDVVKRVPGVSVLNNFVLVRGMDPRYNITMLNGMKTPSAEMDTRAFKFNLLPTGVIDEIMVYKSPSPELPGNFGGGVVKVKTKSTTRARELKISLSAQYRQGSGFKDHIGYAGTSKDWYGGGVEDRELPALLMDPDYELPDFEDYPNEVTQLANSLPEVRLPEKQHHNLDLRGGLQYYDSWKIGRMQLNNLTSIGYTTERQFVKKDLLYEAELVDYDETTNTFSRDENQGRSAKDSIYTQNIRISAMENLGLTINKDHVLSLNTFFNRSATDQTLIRQGEVDEGDDYFVKTYSFKYQVRDLYQIQLTGSHTLGSNLITWSIGKNQVTDKVPDLQRFNYYNSNAGTNWSFTPGGEQNARISFDTEENGQIYQVDYTKTLSGFQESDATIKAGAYWEKRDRIFTSGRYQVNMGPNAQSGTLPLSGVAPWNGLIDSLYSHYFLEDGTGLILVSSSYPGRFSLDDDIRAAYVSVQIPLWHDKISVSGGVRYEWNERYVYDEDGNTIEWVQTDATTYVKTPDKIQVFWLPSVNVSYHFSEKALLRISYGKTIDRPQYREQSNFKYFDFEQGAVIFPNALLKNAEINNYDLRLEYYPSPSEFLAAGCFYKTIANAIERMDYSTSAWKYPAFQYVNTDEASVYGLEAEVRKNLAFLHPSFESFSIIFNGAWLHSNVKTEDFDRPMQGTSPYLINAGLYYDNKTTHTRASVLYNVTGPRLQTAPAILSTHGGLYEQRRHLVDMTLTQELSPYISMKAGVQNLLNAPVKFFRDDNRNKRYNGINENPAIIGDGNTYWNDYIEQSYKEGAYYSLGIIVTI